MAVAKDADDDDDDSAEMTTAAPEPEATTVAADAAAGNRRKRAAEDENNEVTIMFESVQEKNDAGEAVGSGNAEYQGLAAFTEVTFTIGDVNEDDTIMHSKTAADEPIKAASLQYQATLKQDGKMVVKVYIAKEDGNITLGDGEKTEITTVKKGQVKFTVHVEGWKWCTDAGNCKKADDTNEIGKFLDLSISVKGKGEATAQAAVAGMSMTFDIGNDNFMHVSKMMKAIDNSDVPTWVELPTDYPKPSKKDADTTMMTMRMPMFEKSAWYDPSVLMKIPGGDGTSAAPSMMPGSVVALLLAALLAALWM